MPEYQRKLPHFHPDDTWLFLTWRLYGSMPARADSIVYPTAGRAFVGQDRILDRSSTGPRWLLDPRIADLVANAILTGDSERRFYQLGAWVVMPNHAHSVDSAFGSRPGSDEVAERIDCEESEPNPGPNRKSVLAGGVLGSLPA
jgi:hypothetical protein